MTVFSIRGRSRVLGAAVVGTWFMVIPLGAMAEEGAALSVSEPIKVRTWKKDFPFKLEGNVEFGGQTLSGNTGSPTLKEYRDLDGKPTIPNLHLKAEDRLGTKFLELGGTNMTRTDGSFFLRGGQYNRLQFDFDYNRQPHIIGLNRTQIFTHLGGGKFVLPGGPLDPTTEAAFNATPGTDPAQRNAIEAAVNSLLQPTPLGFQTDTAGVGFRYLPYQHLELSAHYSRIDKNGTRPFGGVIGSPGSNVVELAAPKKERIHEVITGLEYGQDWYQFRFNYNLSMFKNSFEQVEWDNVCGNGAACGNTSGLGRTAMMPDNYAHTFSTSGGLSVPWWQTRLTGTLSYNLWRQNQSFLPVSTLETRNFTDAGAMSPDAKMDVLLTNLNLTSRPLRDVTLNLRYRYYHLDNNTPTHTFTGVIRPGDTGAGQTHSNVPISFRKQNTSADATWRITSKVTAKAGYEWERWGRSFREVAEMGEHIGKASVDYRPLHWITTRVSYSHGVRTIGANGYVPLGGNAIALPQFRKFDQSDRTRDKGEWFVQLNPTETVTFSATFFAQQDHFFNTSFGLQESRAYGYSGDVSWAPHERVTLFGGYAHDDYQSRQQNCHIPFGATTCSLDNTFFAKPRDILDTWQAGMTLVVIPDRLDVDLNYRFTFGRSKFGMSSVPGGASAGEPVQMPEIKNVFHVVNVSARYALTPHWFLRTVYLYERYRETDFTVDNVTPSLANVTVDGFTTSTAADVRSVLVPIQHQAYEAHFAGFSLGYTF